MGNATAKLTGYETASSSDEAVPSTSGVKKKVVRKRKGATDVSDSGLSTKKITKLDTAKYVYEKLFLGGEGSDITICAVGHMWNLHKLYLKQCKYFDAILREESRWKEINDDILRLEFPDGKVSVEALHAVLGSLYHNEIEFDIIEIEGILSAASVLQLESVLDKSAELMVEMMDDTNVVRFLKCSLDYGQPTVLNKASQYLKCNFWRLAKERDFLTELPVLALSRLVSSSDTLIVEGEQDLYNILKTWIFLNNGGSCSCSEEEFQRLMEEFYRSEKDIYSRYSELWTGVRLHHMTTSIGSLKGLEKDNIFPKEVIQAAIVDQWKCVLRNEEEPNIAHEISDDSFLISALRLGRIVDTAPKCWRWTGHNNGIDIILNFTHGILTMKRNCLSQAAPYSVNIKTERPIHYRVVVTDMNGSQMYDGGKQLVSLRMDQSIVIARLAHDYSLPLSVHLFYLAAQPPPPAFLYANQYAKRLHQQVEVKDESSATELSTDYQSSSEDSQ